MNVGVDAADNVAVATVDITIDGVKTTKSAPPYEVPYVVKTVATPTSVPIQFVAKDLAGNPATLNRSLLAKPPPVLSNVTLAPATVLGGAVSVGTVTLSDLAPTGGIVVALSSSSPATATVLANVAVPAGVGSAPFNVTSLQVPSSTPVTISAVYAGVTKTATLTVNRNTPPTVSLTAPANGANFAAPATIAMSATAADTDGTIAKVEFYQGATKVGEKVTAPFTFSWTGVGPGAYALTARAIDNLGAATTSSAVNVTVASGNYAGVHSPGHHDAGNLEGAPMGSRVTRSTRDATAYPYYAQTTVTGQTSVHVDGSTADVRAFRRPPPPTAVAGVWYSGTNFTVDLTLTDGLTHRSGSTASTGTTTAARRRSTSSTGRRAPFSTREA